MPITTREERIAHERWLASKSTYGSCVCGPDHVSGCKVAVTNRFLLAAVIVLAAAAVAWFY